MQLYFFLSVISFAFAAQRPLLQRPCDAMRTCMDCIADVNEEVRIQQRREERVEGCTRLCCLIGCSTMSFAQWWGPFDYNHVDSCSILLYWLGIQRPYNSLLAGVFYGRFCHDYICHQHRYHSSGFSENEQWQQRCNYCHDVLSTCINTGIYECCGLIPDIDAPLPVHME